MALFYAIWQKNLSKNKSWQLYEYDRQTDEAGTELVSDGNQPGTT